MTDSPAALPLFFCHKLPLRNTGPSLNYSISSHSFIQNDFTGVSIDVSMFTVGILKNYWRAKCKRTYSC